MMGDYNRYLAEIDGEGAAAVADATEAYQTAMAAAKALPATNAIRLGLALTNSNNKCIFFLMYIYIYIYIYIY